MTLLKKAKANLIDEIIKFAESLKKKSKSFYKAKMATVGMLGKLKLQYLPYVGSEFIKYLCRPFIENTSHAKIRQCKNSQAVKIKQS